MKSERERGRDANQQGLVSKYEVRRYGEEVHDCFVLRYDRDPHALIALAAYAAAVRVDNPELSDDLWRLVKVGVTEHA